ncbi:hypothetical protein L6164_022435 [Bauhinia variegata]|uniref:Uncharacterized protein n=1 Tax=Bauhinia variegata TaxID=167791 RepID=A0ACB9MG50_BAUVA|nr:hypothetical protein L6164_022435 [Bauhinia variegata]
MRPPSKRIDFHRDDFVEVCSNEQGFQGSYYEARVISRVDNGLYVVEYKNVLENDESGPLVETVYPKELRPLPPTNGDKLRVHQEFVRGKWVLP